MSLVGTSELNWDVDPSIRSHPSLTYSPWGGMGTPAARSGPSLVDSSAYFLPLAAAEPGLPMPDEVRAIYRVQTWRIEAIFTDPYEVGEPTRFDLSTSFSETVAAGTAKWVLDTYEGGSSTEVIEGTPWTTIDQALYFDRPPYTLGGNFRFGLNSQIASFYLRNEFLLDPEDEESEVGVHKIHFTIWPPAIRALEDGTAEWVLPVMPGEFVVQFATGTDPTYDIAGFATGWSERNSGYGHGRTMLISGFGETAGEADLSLYPPHTELNGWSLTLSIDSSF